MVCSSSFVPFALFAVQEIQKEWLLEFNREMHENRESLYGLFLLVLVVRVVRGSKNSNGVPFVIGT